VAPDPLRAHLAASMAATSSEARSQNSSGSRAVNCGHDCGRRGRASGRRLGRGLIVSSSAGVEVGCRLVSSAGLHGMLLAAAATWADCLLSLHNRHYATRLVSTKFLCRTRGFVPTGDGMSDRKALGFD